MSDSVAFSVFRRHNLSMITKHLLTLSAAATIATVLSVSMASAETRATTSSSSKALLNVIRSSSSKSTASVPKHPITTTVTDIPELPNCNNSKEDQTIVYDVKMKKWICKSISTLVTAPPKCDGADQALRYDGKAWKCETVAGLLIGHSEATFYPTAEKKYVCETGNTWGAGTCTLGKTGYATLACSGNATKVFQIYAYEDMVGDEIFIEHAWCFSRPIKIAK